MVELQKAGLYFVRRAGIPVRVNTVLIKGGKMGVPLIVSLSKPTELALELADRLRISVVGNLRGSRGM